VAETAEETRTGAVGTITSHVRGVEHRVRTHVAMAVRKVARKGRTCMRAHLLPVFVWIEASFPLWAPVVFGVARALRWPGWLSASWRLISNEA